MSNVFVSVFAKVVAAEHSTVAWLEKEIVVLEGEAPTIERVVDTGLAYIGPALQLSLTFLGDAPAAALVGVVVQKAQADLKAASALITDFGPTPTAATMFQSVETNLTALLAAGQVTSSKSVAAVTKAINEIGILGTAIQLAAAALAASVAPAPVAA